MEAATEAMPTSALSTIPILFKKSTLLLVRSTVQNTFAKVGPEWSGGEGGRRAEN
jgi:hypothetical protein